MTNTPQNPDPRSYKQRLDPDGKHEQLTKFLSSPVGRFVGRAAGLDREALGKAVADYTRLTTEPDRIATALGPLGWVLCESVPLAEYSTAATLVENGRPEDADKLLVEKWNSSDSMLRGAVQRLVNLYGEDPERVLICNERRRLLLIALDLHRAEKYAAAIPIILAQMDGIFMDFTFKPTKEFFDPRNPNLTDDSTFAGHPLGIATLSKIMNVSIAVTRCDDTLSRHGILHGRVLKYDTKINSTKLWAALLAITDALKPRARALNDELKRKREAKYAGSKATDADGRRLDRRGFNEAKKILQRIVSYQFGSFKNSGQYRDDKEYFVKPDDNLDGMDLSIRTSTDPVEFWAWIVTPTGFTFGVAGREGRFPCWQYSGEVSPSGGPSSDKSWRDIATDPAPTEW